MHLAGHIRIEAAAGSLSSDQFPGPQGKLAFAFLMLRRNRPVARSELATVLWPSNMPAAWDNALSALMSKVRALLAPLGPAWEAALTGGHGAFEFVVPSNVWVDVEAAAESMHEAESAVRRGAWPDAYGPSAVAHHIARRPFLPHASGFWVESQRDQLRDILLRALELRAELYLWNGEPILALQNAKELLVLEPFREAGYRLVMRAHAALGNSAEALRAYEQCRRLILRELGVGPSPQTKAVHDEILRAV